MQLKDKVILLTGGSTGIGWECAKAYAKEGAKVALIALEPEAAGRAAEELGEGHRGWGCDLTRAESVQQMVEGVITAYGKLDAVHNNAGIASPSKMLHETTLEEWDLLMNTNLRSVFLTTKYSYSALQKTRGSILNTSSLVGSIGQEIHAAYTATKGGMNALTKSMALDYARAGIRVNAIAPAGVWTPMVRTWASEQPNPAAVSDYLSSIHPLGYCPEGDVIADAAVFLLSDKARFITGHILPVSGGAELGYRRST